MRSLARTEALDVGTAAFHEIWITAKTPARIAATEPEPTDRPVRTPPPVDGVVVRFTEMAPGAESPMHRTETVDVGVVLEGETWLLLDGRRAHGSARPPRSGEGHRVWRLTPRVATAGRAPIRPLA